MPFELRIVHQVQVVLGSRGLRLGTLVEVDELRDVAIRGTISRLGLWLLGTEMLLDPLVDGMMLVA